MPSGNGVIKMSISYNGIERCTSKHLYLFYLVILTVNLSAQPDIIWQTTYGGSGLDYCYAARQTADNGFVFAGVKTLSCGNGADFWLLKTDQDGSIQWQNSFGGTANDYAYSLTQTSDGGYVLTGFTESFGAGGRDVWLVKTDELGNLLWSNTLGLSNWDEGRAVIQTDDEGFIVAGSITSYFTGTVDVLLARFNSSGDLLWTKSYGESGSESGLSVQQTADGGYVVTGCTSSWGAGSDDLYLLKTDSQGTMEWDQTFGGSHVDWGRSVQQTSDGGYIVTGYTSSYGSGYEDVWLIKTDEEGNLQWDRTYGGSLSDEGSHVQQTFEGGYVISATTGSYGAGSLDLWVIKTDSNGNVQWDLTRGGSDWDTGHSVEQTSDGGYIVAGDTRSFGSGSSDAILVRIAPEVGIEDVEIGNSPAFISIPNPIHFSSSTQIEFILPEPDIVSLTLYNISGREVGTAASGFFPGGLNSIEWSIPNHLSPGCYLLRLRSSYGSDTRKLVLIK